MSVKLPSVPETPLGTENKEAFDAIKLILETREGTIGDVEERSITVRDLIELGLATKADIEKMFRSR